MTLESESDARWLVAADYRIEALNPRLAGAAVELRFALDSGVDAIRDPNRKGFYNVELPTGWAYIHVREHSKTVHLIAFGCRRAGKQAS